VVCLPAKIEAVQIYQGGYNHGSGWDGVTRGHVSVAITSPSENVYLVLSAYEPVEWDLSGDVAKVVGVRVHGYYSGLVVGVSAGLVDSDSYDPYNQPSGDGYPYTSVAGTLVSRTSSLTGYPIDTVQGVYDSTKFTIVSH
jgi:hypothetical protein